MKTVSKMWGLTSLFLILSWFAGFFSLGPG